MSSKLKVDGHYNKDLLADILIVNIMILTLCIALWKQDWAWVIGCMFGASIFIVPLVLGRYRNDIIPWPIDLMAAAICTVNMIGALLEGYYTIPYLSLIMQMLVAVFVAFVAFALVYMLNEYWDGLEMNGWAMLYVTTVTAMAGMVVYECIKFFGLFGIPTVSSVQMLQEMIFGSIGGVLMGVFCMWLVKKDRMGPLFDTMGHEFVEEKFVKHFEEEGSDERSSDEQK